MEDEGTFALNPEMVRRKWPPKIGWFYRQPETGWNTPNPKGDNYQITVQKILKHRQANPQIPMSTSVRDVERDLQQQTALRLLEASPADAREWIVALDQAAELKKKPQPSSVQRLESGVVAAVAGAARRIRRDLAGLGVLTSWLGRGGKPVAPELATQRASICVTCRKNQPGYKAETAVAQAIRRFESARQHLALKTPHDDKLNTCAVCLCHLPLKVHVPIQKIRLDTDWTKQPDWCWIKTETPSQPSISVRRRGAYGDVIVASVVAERIAEKGYDVTLVCDEMPGQSVKGHPSIKIAHTGPFDVDLDAAYELSRDLGDLHIYNLMHGHADKQLRKFGIHLGEPKNCVPTVVVTDAERAAMSARMVNPTGKIVVIPKSQAWINRTVGEPIWREVAAQMMGAGGTLYWASKDKGYQPLIDLRAHAFRDVMAAMACADIVATVDTGPMHAAAGLKKPILAIKQAFRIDLRLTDHTDWQEVGAKLDCLGCCKYKCPINAGRPPCGDVPAETIANALKARMGVYDLNRVAAVVPVYKPDLNRIGRVVAAIENQVDEIVIPLDGECRIDFKHPKVRVIENPTRRQTGYGKTAMRGARLTNSGWLFLLNDDCYMAPDAIAHMKNAADDKTAVVGCLLRYPNGKIQHGGTYTPPGSFGWGHIDVGRIDPIIKSTTEMDGVTLASALIRRRAFYDVGGFDDHFFCYGEDEDFCRSLRLNGWKIMYEPRATGIHEESLSTGPHKMAMIRQAHQLLKEKWS